MGVRSQLSGHLPAWAYTGLRRSLRVLPSRRRHDATMARVEAALDLEASRVVRGGPFVGMRYIEDSVGSSLAPKILGAYELEIHPAIESLIGVGRIDSIVDIGCAEGYYAVGLARRCPEATVAAFDTSPRARELCRGMARLNGVSERVQVSGRITPEGLRAALRPGTLLICDCEGYERVLIDPVAVPELAEADLIVELHDFLDPGISTAIAERFAASHMIELVDSRPREPDEIGGAIDAIPAEDRAYALDEGRPGPMQWAVMTRLRSAI